MVDSELDIFTTSTARVLLRVRVNTTTTDGYIDRLMSLRKRSKKDKGARAIFGFEGRLLVVKSYHVEPKSLKSSSGAAFISHGSTVSPLDRI